MRVHKGQNSDMSVRPETQHGMENKLININDTIGDTNTCCIKMQYNGIQYGINATLYNLHLIPVTNKKRCSKITIKKNNYLLQYAEYFIM